MPQSHLNLQRFEIVRNTGLGLTTHPLACPLLESIKLFVDIHDYAGSEFVMPFIVFS